MSSHRNQPQQIARDILAGAAKFENTLSLIDRASLAFLRALQQAELASPHEQIANALAWIAKDYSSVLRALARLDEDGIYSSALAKACGTQLDPLGLLRAHAAITTEITGPSTYHISIALARSAILNPELRSFKRYGVDKSLWESCLLDFWREYSPHQMKSVCEALLEADPAGKPSNLLGAILLDAQYGVFHDEFNTIQGALEAIPKLALEPGLPMAIDNAAAHADQASRQSALALFEMARRHGMQLGSAPLRNFQTPEIKAHIEACMLSDEIARPASADKTSLRV